MSTQSHETLAIEASAAPFSVGLLDRETYLAFRREFRQSAQLKFLPPGLMALRALLLGRPLKKAFSPIRNPRKLANGQAMWGGLERALSKGELEFAVSCIKSRMTEEEKTLLDRIVKPASVSFGKSLLEIARRKALADLASDPSSTTPGDLS